MTDWTQWGFKVLDPLRFTVPARKITRVFLHCTASDQEFMRGLMLVEEVNRWHLARQWSGVGYHEMIDKEGTVIGARPAEMQGAAQLGKDQLGNIAAYAICVHGNWSFTAESMEAVVVRCRAIDEAFRLAGKKVTFHGHREIDPKPCPIFDYVGLLGLDAEGNFGVNTSFDPSEVAKAASRPQS